MLTIACIQALRVNCAFLRHQVPVIEITPEQICIKFQFISSEFMNHEQFALLQSPHTRLIQECSLKWEKNAN